MALITVNPRFLGERRLTLPHRTLPSRPRLEPRRFSRARYTPGSASGRSSAAAAGSPAT